MKLLFKISVIVFIIMTFSTTAYPQEAKYNKLNTKLAKLYKNENIKDAIKVAKEALEVAKKTFGENHPYVSASLNNLALLYTEDCKYEKAAELYEQSLKIAEARLGKNHPHLAGIIENMITCSEVLGKTEKTKCWKRD